MTMLCIAKVGKLREYKREGSFTIGKLDDMMKTFPIKHSMPLRMKHFSEGISTYCSGISGSKKKQETGLGDLGIIDSKDVPSLVLQLLLCKYNFKNIIKHFENVCYVFKNNSYIIKNDIYIFNVLFHVTYIIK